MPTLRRGAASVIQLIGPRPGTTGVSLDPLTGQPSAYTHTTGNISIAFNVHEGYPVALVGGLLTGYRVNRVSGLDANCSLDLALCRMRAYNEAPGPLELLADTLATVTWDANDTFAVDTPVTPCAAPTPIAPGWYWLVWKGVRTAGLTAISAQVGTQKGAAMNRIRHLGVTEPQRLIDVLNRANTLNTNIGIQGPVQHLVFA